MRIGLLVPGFSVNSCDWGIPALAHLVRALADRHEVTVFALRHPCVSEAYEAFGARVVPFAWGTRAGMVRPLLLAAGVRRVVREGRRLPFDVLHAFWGDEAGYLAVAAAGRLGVPSVVTLMGGELVALPDIRYGTQLSLAGRWLVRRSLARADRVTVGSAFTEAMVRPLVANGRLRRLPVGVNTSLFSPAAQSSPPLAGRFQLLQVASLVPVKDQEMLLRALAIAAPAAPGIHLHIVGVGPLRAVLERRAAVLDIATSVTFHGAVAHPLLPAYYRACNVCVQSSRFESQSLATLEAGACGRTSIGTAVGFLPELEPAARTVAVADAPALASVIVELAREPERAARLGVRCRTAVTTSYTLAGTVASLGHLYEELRAHPAPDVEAHHTGA
jgi:glycogen(starch) synthase